MSTTHERGRALEEQIGNFLAHHGYQVRWNLVLQGRSGASHELDVVGDKSDGLTSFRLVVECKAWASPIDKDVVYKLAAVLADLGAAKGVIAALSGWTVQAAQAAAQANIELWGPEQLNARLGNVPMADIRTAAPVQAIGVPFDTSADRVHQLVERLASGTLGLGRETIDWFGPIWLPVLMLQLGITRLDGRFRPVPRVTRIFNSYEMLAGDLVVPSPMAPSTVQVDLGGFHIRILVTEPEIRDRVTITTQRWRAAKTDSAKQQQFATLGKLGVQPPLRDLVVERSSLWYAPLWAAFLGKGGRERIVAIDGVTGKERPGLGQIMTAQSHWIRESLAADR